MNKNCSSYLIMKWYRFFWNTLHISNDINFFKTPSRLWLVNILKLIHKNDLNKFFHQKATFMITFVLMKIIFHLFFMIPIKQWFIGNFLNVYPKYEASKRKLILCVIFIYLLINKLTCYSVWDILWLNKF